MWKSLAASPADHHADKRHHIRSGALQSVHASSIANLAGVSVTFPSFTEGKTNSPSPAAS
jgi:hypothetical protein